MNGNKNWAEGLALPDRATRNYIRAAEDLEQHLKRLRFTDGTNPVDISIKIADRNVTTEYKLYDHAALVQGLMDAVSDFLDNI